MAGIKIGIEITKIEPFKALMKYIASLATDRRLPLEIREEIMAKLENLTEVE